jgi:four helix bundle protein
MATFKSFEEIDGWQRARRLSRRIYELSNRGTFARDFSLKDQINRATGSIMDNLAEGFGRGGNREFIQSLSYSQGSVRETQSQLYRALDRKHISQAEFESLKTEAVHLGNLVGALMKYLSASGIKGPKFRDPARNTKSDPTRN